MERDSESSGRKQPGSLKWEGWIRGAFSTTALLGWLGVCLHTSFDGDSLLSEAVHASLWANPFKHSFSNGSKWSAVSPNWIVSRCMVPWLPENLVVLSHPPEAFLH